MLLVDTLWVICMLPAGCTVLCLFGGLVARLVKLVRDPPRLPRAIVVASGLPRCGDGRHSLH
jgi:hypothetical protein